MAFFATFFLGALFFFGAAFFAGLAFFFAAVFFFAAPAFAFAFDAGFGAVALPATACKANITPCGSAPIEIQPPPGTSAGPCMIVAPSDFALAVAVFASATLIYGSHAGGPGCYGGFTYMPPKAVDPSGPNMRYTPCGPMSMSDISDQPKSCW